MERADGAVFASAKNQLLPADAEEYGPYDGLLEAGHCVRILKLMAKEDYVINLLKDDFRAKYGREPNSLSDIARILAEREKIKKEPRVPGPYIELGRRYFGVGKVDQYLDSTHVLSHVSRSHALGVLYEV